MNRLSFRAFVVSSLLFVGSSVGMAAPMPSTGNDKLLNQMSAQLVVTPLDKPSVAKAYEKLGKFPSSVLHMTTDGRLSAIVILKGCQTDSQGNCNVTAKSKILKWDGTTFAASVSSYSKEDPTIIPVMIGKREGNFDAPNIRQEGQINFDLQKAQGNFKPELVAGEYLFYISYTDHNSDNTIVLWKAVRVSAAKVK